MTYAFPPGGMPAMTDNPAANRAVFTTAYAFIPAATMRDITASLLPGWTRTRAWIIARPLSGFAETFAQYAVEVKTGGGCVNAEPDPSAEGVVFIASGTGTLTVNGTPHPLSSGTYAYLPPGGSWRIDADSDLQFHWIRRRWTPDTATPAFFITTDAANPVHWMPGSHDQWGTTRFVDPTDMAHDMHVNIVTFTPGGRIPFAETHVMEHGLYVLEGTAEYLLNTDWVSVGPGDFMWLRAFCPQACIATGTGPFRYLLYKDVNRHPALTLA